MDADLQSSNHPIMYMPFWYVVPYPRLTLLIPKMDFWQFFYFTITFFLDFFFGWEIDAIYCSICDHMTNRTVLRQHEKIPVLREIFCFSEIHFNYERICFSFLSLSHYYYKFALISMLFFNLLQICFKLASNLFQICFKLASSLFQICFEYSF